MADRMSIIRAMDDLFSLFFRGACWLVWRVFLKGIFALPMSGEELAIYQRFTGRETATSEQAREAWLVCGRRSGKSYITAFIAVFLACFREYRQYLSPGERGVVMVLAADRKQARVIFRYILAFLNGVPMLKRLIVAERADGLELSNGIDIEIHTASFKSVRGYTVVAALCDEIAFWPTDDSAAPDKEIIAALVPAMSTIPGALLIGLSSPYGRRGVLWEKYRNHHGQDGEVLVWQADTRSMNPTVPQSIIDRAYADDPTAAAAEYGAQFRSDVSAFLLPEWLDAATIPGRHELPPVEGTTYFAFADPSGGGSDSFTMGIAHREGEEVILDVLRGRRPPFDPKSVVAEFSSLVKQYRLHRVTGDKYAGEWVPSAFREHGVTYDHSSLTKSEIYLETEPLFARGSVRLLDHRILGIELRQLERRVGSQKDRVDHPPRGHDDYANAACGALWLAGAQRTPITEEMFIFVKPPDRFIYPF